MQYIEGIIAAVATSQRAAYRQHAEATAALFAEFGATRYVAAWGDDVPEGKATDFKGAVKAQPDEVVAFSWVEFPSQKIRDEATRKLRNDARMQQLGQSMPCDGLRMVIGGFRTIIDNASKGPMGYLDGSLLPVPTANREVFHELTAKHVAVLTEHGALRVVDGWEDDVVSGKVTDYRRAVKARQDESIVFSWVEWPSKQGRQQGWQKIMADPRMHSEEMPYDGQRWIYGGFVPIFDSAALS
jgi:uncharacterized protein YbaA (DUF1428 family)